MAAPTSTPDDFFLATTTPFLPATAGAHASSDPATFTPKRKTAAP